MIGEVTRQLPAKFLRRVMPGPGSSPGRLLSGRPQSQRQYMKGVDGRDTGSILGTTPRGDDPGAALASRYVSGWYDSERSPRCRPRSRKNPSSGRNRKRTNNSNRKTKARSQLPPSGGAETGPCLTDAAPEAAPDRAAREKAATPKPERVPRRSWRQSAPVVPCPSPQLVGRIGAAADALPPLRAA